MYEGTSYFCWKPYRPHDIAQPWLLSWPLTQFNKNFNWSEVVFPCQARLPEPSWLFLAALLSHGISWRKNSVLYSSIFLNVSGRCLHLWFPGPFFSLWFGFSLSLPVLLLFLICYLVLDHLLCKMSVVFGFFFNRPWVKRVTRVWLQLPCLHQAEHELPVTWTKVTRKRSEGNNNLNSLFVRKPFAQILRQHATVKLSVIIYTFLPISQALTHFLQIFSVFTVKCWYPKTIFGTKYGISITWNFK